MKSLIVSMIFSLLASVGFASNSPEATLVARLLVNNPDVVAQLRNNNSSHLKEWNSERVKQGVNKYTLTFERRCFCKPSTATVTIVEDLTPTYADGAPEYTSQVVIKE